MEHGSGTASFALLSIPSIPSLGLFVFQMGSDLKLAFSCFSSRLQRLLLYTTTPKLAALCNFEKGSVYTV